MTLTQTKPVVHECGFCNRYIDVSVQYCSQYCQQRATQTNYKMGA